MVIEPAIVHDLKSERPDVSPPLPASLRLVPILFYVTVVGIGLLTLFLLTRINAAHTDLAYWKEEAEKGKGQLQQVQALRTSLDGSARRAAEVVSWVDGSRPMHPLILTITRSISPSSTIEELVLERNPEAPSQLKIAMKLNTGGPRQLNKTLDLITAMNYRPYSAQQEQEEGAIDYSATLLWQRPGRTETPAAEPTPPGAIPPPSAP